MTNIENNFGFIFPKNVERCKEKQTPWKNCSVVFQPRNCTYKGVVRWFGKINGCFNVYGIETVPINLGTNGTFNGHKLFLCPKECGVLIKDTLNIFKIDEDHGFIEDKTSYRLESINQDATDCLSDIVVLKQKESIKVGRVLSTGKLQDISCYQIQFPDDKKEYLFVKNDILGSFADQNGIVDCSVERIYNLSQIDSVYHVKIGEWLEYRNANINITGVLKWKGVIDGFKCIAIDPDVKETVHDVTKLFKVQDAFWIVICIERLINPPCLLDIESNLQVIQETCNRLHEITENNAFSLVDNETLKTSFCSMVDNLTNQMMSPSVHLVLDAQKDNKRQIGDLLKNHVNDFNELNVRHVTNQSCGESSIEAMLLNFKKELLHEPNKETRAFKTPYIVVSSDMSICLQINKSLNPETIILLLDSLEDLKDENIKSFLAAVGTENGDRHFMVIFNKLYDFNCSDMEQCCFSDDVRTFLDNNNIQFEDRIFTASSLLHPDHTKDHFDTEESLNPQHQKTLEREFGADRKFEQFKQMSSRAQKMVNDIHENFNKERAYEEINQCGSLMVENSESFMDCWDHYEHQATDNLTKSLNEIIGKSGNLGIAENCFENHLQMKSIMGKEMINLMQNFNNYSNTNMLTMVYEKFKAFRTAEDKKKIKSIVNANFENFKKEKINETSSAEDNTENLGQSEADRITSYIQKTTLEITSLTKESCQRFLEVFNSEAIKDVNKFKETIDIQSMEYRSRIWAEDKRLCFNKLMSTISKEVETMKGKIIKGCSTTTSIIHSQKSSNIYPKYLGAYILDSMKKMRIGKEIQAIENGIIEAPINELCHFVEKLRNLDKLKNVLKKSDNGIAIFLGNLNEEIYYQDSMEGLSIIRKAFNRVIGWKNGGTRYIKILEILGKLEALQRHLLKYVQEVEKEYIKTLSDLIEYGQENLQS